MVSVFSAAMHSLAQMLHGSSSVLVSFLVSTFGKGDDMGLEENTQCHAWFARVRCLTHCPHTRTNVTHQRSFGLRFIDFLDKPGFFFLSHGMCHSGIMRELNIFTAL